MKESGAWCLFVCLFVTWVGRKLVTLEVRNGAAIETFISQNFVY
jgi:hypothetical protein